MPLPEHPTGTVGIRMGETPMPRFGPTFVRLLNPRGFSYVESLVNRTRSWQGVMPILFGLIYGVSPIDLIPDILPLIGWVDDAILVPMLLIMGILQMRKARKVSAATEPIYHPPTRR